MPQDAQVPSSSEVWMQRKFSQLQHNWGIVANYLSFQCLKLPVSKGSSFHRPHCGIPSATWAPSMHDSAPHVVRGKELSVLLNMISPWATFPPVMSCDNGRTLSCTMDGFLAKTPRDQWDTLILLLRTLILHSNSRESGHMPSPNLAKVLQFLGGKSVK